MQPIECCGPRVILVEHKDPITIKLRTYTPVTTESGVVAAEESWRLLSHQAAFNLAVALLAHVDLSKVEEPNEDASQRTAQVWEEAIDTIIESPNAALANSADYLSVYGRILNSIPDPTPGGPSGPTILEAEKDPDPGESSPEEGEGIRSISGYLQKVGRSQGREEIPQEAAGDHPEAEGEASDTEEGSVPKGET